MFFLGAQWAWCTLVHNPRFDKGVSWSKILIQISGGVTKKYTWSIQIASFLTILAMSFASWFSPRPSYCSTTFEPCTRYSLHFSMRKVRLFFILLVPLNPTIAFALSIAIIHLSQPLLLIQESVCNIAFISASRLQGGLRRRFSNKNSPPNFPHDLYKYLQQLITGNSEYTTHQCWFLKKLGRGFQAWFSGLGVVSFGWLFE